MVAITHAMYNRSWRLGKDLDEIMQFIITDIAFFVLFKAAFGGWNLSSVCFLLAFFAVQFKTAQQGKMVSHILGNLLSSLGYKSWFKGGIS